MRGSPASLLFALGLFAACGDGDGLAVEGVDAVALLAAAADRTEQVQSFHFVLEHERGSTEIVRGVKMKRAEGDVAGGEQLRVDIEGSVGPLNINLGIVILEHESWITNPLTGRWEREDISITELFDPATGVTALIRAVTEPRVTGSDRIDGVQTYRVEATVDSGAVRLFGDPQAGKALRAKVWIGVDDPLIHRIELEGPLRRGERDDLLRRITLSRFDSDPEIVAPR
ncbi:MAG: LppX_LprAFG lipoprotein [Dehalococcoidia bacterium]